MNIRKAELSDAVQIADIYNHYIRNTIITFEEKEISHAEIHTRIENVFSDALPWIVAESDNRIVGYAYAAKWKTRSAYRFSLESTVYLEPDSVGNGTGTLLYRELLPSLQGSGIHAVIAGIALPNPASIALHEKFGFKKVAYFNEVGIKFNRWIDVGYWQILLHS